MRRYFPGAGNSGTTSRSTTPCTSPLPSSSAWCSSRPTKGSARRRGRAAPCSCCGEPAGTARTPSAASAPPVEGQEGQAAGPRVGGVTPPDMRESCQQPTSPRHVTPTSPLHASRGAPRGAAPSGFDDGIASQRVRGTRCWRRSAPQPAGAGCAGPGGFGRSRPRGECGSRPPGRLRSCCSPAVHCGPCDDTCTADGTWPSPAHCRDVRSTGWTSFCDVNVVIYSPTWAVWSRTSGRIPRH